MKHQVFFFLLIFSLSTYAMNKNEQKFIKIIERCCVVNQCYPGAYDIKQLEEATKELITLSHSEQEKILKEARNYVPRKIRETEDHVVFLWDSNEKNKYRSNNKIY